MFIAGFEFVYVNFVTVKESKGEILESFFFVLLECSLFLDIFFCFEIENLSLTQLVFSFSSFIFLGSRIKLKTWNSWIPLSSCRVIPSDSWTYREKRITVTFSFKKRGKSWGVYQIWKQEGSFTSKQKSKSWFSSPLLVESKRSATKATLNRCFGARLTQQNL